MDCVLQDGKEDRIYPRLYPLALRERFVGHVESGHSHRSTASNFQVSIKFVNDIVKLKRETGSLEAQRPPGRSTKGKLEAL
jgi:transposase